METTIDLEDQKEQQTTVCSETVQATPPKEEKIVEKVTILKSDNQSYDNSENPLEKKDKVMAADTTILCPLEKINQNKPIIVGEILSHSNPQHSTETTLKESPATDDVHSNQYLPTINWGIYGRSNPEAIPNFVTRLSDPITTAVFRRPPSSTKISTPRQRNILHGLPVPQNKSELYEYNKKLRNSLLLSNCEENDMANTKQEGTGFKSNITVLLPVKKNQKIWDGKEVLRSADYPIESIKITDNTEENNAAHTKQDGTESKSGTTVEVTIWLPDGNNQKSWDWREVWHSADFPMEYVRMTDEKMIAYYKKLVLLNIIAQQSKPNITNYNTFTNKNKTIAKMLAETMSIAIFVKTLVAQEISKESDLSNEDFFSLFKAVKDEASGLQSNVEDPGIDRENITKQ